MKISIAFHFMIILTNFCCDKINNFLSMNYRRSCAERSNLHQLNDTGDLTIYS